MSGNSTIHGKNGNGNWVPMSANPWERWTGTGTGNAPTGMDYVTIGFDGDGTGYEYVPATGWAAVDGWTYNKFLGNV